MIIGAHLCKNTLMPIISTTKMTAQQFLRLSEDPPGVRLEMVNGEVAASPNPMPNHSHVVVNLITILNTHVLAHDLGELHQERGAVDSTIQMNLAKRRTRREISDRQRFRILVRDGFRCKSCGKSPFAEPDVELHVDHVLPWSKGGETTDYNLETKCKQCNLGKGNAFNA